MTTLIRYLTSEKFKWLLSDGGIYLGAAAHQSDELEGVYDHTYVSNELGKGMDLGEDLRAGIDSQYLQLMHARRNSRFINSWYIGEGETQEMWQEYGADGVVIVSSIEDLQFSIPEPLEQATSFQKVIYSDSEKAVSISNPLSCKNERFSHEKEWRIIFDLTAYSVLTGYGLEPNEYAYIGGEPTHKSKQITACMSERGINQSHDVIHRKGEGYVLHYDLNLIIREIRLNPKATELERAVVKSLCLERGIKCEVNFSMFNSVLG